MGARSSPAGARRAVRACPRRVTNVRWTLEHGRPFHGARVVAFVAPGRGQVAFVAGRRVGGAVVRNRARRIMRAAWRELAPRMQDDYDVAWVARGGVRGARTQDLVAEMDEVLTRAQVTLW